LLSPRQLARRIGRLLIFSVVLVLFTFIGDTIWLHIRMLKPKPGDPFSSVHLNRIIAIQRKDGRYDLSPAPQEDRPCVQTIFPHGGLSPCWYVKKLNTKPIFL
jgi:hypothetical protein